MLAYGCVRRLGSGEPGESGQGSVKALVPLRLWSPIHRSRRRTTWRLSQLCQTKWRTWVQQFLPHHLLQNLFRATFSIFEMANCTAWLPCIASLAVPPCPASLDACTRETKSNAPSFACAMGAFHLEHSREAAVVLVATCPSCISRLSARRKRCVRVLGPSVVRCPSHTSTHHSGNTWYSLVLIHSAVLALFVCSQITIIAVLLVSRSYFRPPAFAPF